MPPEPIRRATPLALKRYRLFFTVIALVALLSGVKWVFHAWDFEFLSLNALFTSAISSAVFIIGFLLASLLSDYKEADRLPTDLRVALEAIRDDATCFAAANPVSFDLRALTADLAGIVAKIEEGLGYRKDYSGLGDAIAAIDRLSPVFAAMERDGMPANFVVRLRNEQNVLRRAVFRIYTIQKIQFVPSVHILVQTLVAAMIALLLFLETEGSPESALMFGFITYIFIYALYLVRTLERPFHKGHNSVDDVSLFLLREFAAKAKADSDEAESSASDSGPRRRESDRAPLRPAAVLAGEA